MNGFKIKTTLPSKEIVIRDMMGGRTPLTPELFLRLILSRLSLVYFALATLGFIATDPPNMRAHLGLAEQVFVWVCAALCFITLYVILTITFGILARDGRPATVWNLLLTGLALYPTVEACNLMAHALSDGSFPMEGWTRLPFYFVATGVFSEVYFQFVVPLSLQRLALPADCSGERTLPHNGDATRPATVGTTTGQETGPVSARPEPRIVHVGTAQVPLHEIHAMESHAHFVNIRLNGKIRRFRARLCDIVAQTCLEDGIQPHRSWWVSHAAAPSLCDIEGRPVLRLQDGCVVPVARARLGDVQQWLASRSPAI